MPRPSRAVASVAPAPIAPARVAREFRRWIDDGARLLPAGTARRNPLLLLSRGYTPRYRFALFDTIYCLTNIRQNPDLRFFVAYVVQPRRSAPGRSSRAPSGARDIFPRIFYKDVSLVWRSASHLLRSRDGIWIGKGEVREFRADGETLEASVEATTDLPLEIQTALETLARRTRRVPHDEAVLDLVLRRGAPGRIEPFRDFMAPRLAARARGGLVRGGRPVARFTRRGDPTSLVFAPGYEPDFARGILERSKSTSRLYGGRVRRFRILSRNGEIQFLFFAGRRHVWLAPPQATTTELTSYGVRAADANAPEDLSLPGFEYHFLDDGETPPAFHSQIPDGYAGAPSDEDPARADASAWLDRLPVVREFRRKVLRR